MRAAAVIAGGSAERLALSGRLAEQAVTAAEEAGDPELSCEALELLAMALRPRDLTTAAHVLRRELAVAERAGLVLWRLRALNELGNVEALRDARGDRLWRAYELAVRVGALDTAASSLINLAGLYVGTGAIPEAIAAAGQARQLAAALGATQAVAAATALEASAHGLAGRRADMEHGLRRAVELAPGDADIAEWATGGARGLVGLLFEERAEALAAFARARALGAPIRALDPWYPALLVRAVQGEVTVSEVEAELARATAGARFPATWLGYAHAVTLAAAGDAAAAEAAFGNGRTCRQPVPAVPGDRAAAGRRGRAGPPVRGSGGLAARGRGRVRVPAAGPDRRRLPRPARPGRGAGHPAARPRRRRARPGPAPPRRHGPGGRGPRAGRRAFVEQGHRRPAVPVAADGGKARRQPAAQDGRRRPRGARPAGPARAERRHQDGGTAPMCRARRASTLAGTDAPRPGEGS